MTARTSEKTVTFAKPFRLRGFDEVLAPGTYVVETDEELLDGLSLTAYRRVKTLLHLHVGPGHVQVLEVDPNDLESALKRDRA